MINYYKRNRYDINLSAAPNYVVQRNIFVCSYTANPSKVVNIAHVLVKHVIVISKRAFEQSTRADILLSENWPGL